MSSFAYPQVKIGLGIVGGGKLNFSHQDISVVVLENLRTNPSYVWGFNASYISKDERHIVTAGIYQTEFTSAFQMGGTPIYPTNKLFSKVFFPYKGW